MFQYPVLWNSKRNWYFWIRLIEIVKYISYMAWYFSDKWWRFQGWRRLRWRRRHLLTTILGYPILNAFDTPHFWVRRTQVSKLLILFERLSDSRTPKSWKSQVGILIQRGPSTSAEHCNSFEWVILSCKNQVTYSMHEIGTSYWSQLEPIHRIQLTDSNRRLLSSANCSI